jgi:hypothetical protein
MTSRYLFFSLFSMAVLGCNKSAGTSAGESGEPPIEPGPSCDTIVQSTQPSDGSMSHYYREPIVFRLSEPDSTAIVVTDIVGATTFGDDGATIVFTPQGNLSASTQYTVGLDYCYGEPEIEFTTSHYGATLEASTDLLGGTYSLEFTGGEYTVGQDAGQLVNAVFTRPLLLEVITVNEATMDIRLAVGKPGVVPPVQDTCGRTITLRSVSLNELPFISGGVEDFVFGAHGGSLRFSSLAFEGTFASDGETMGGIAYEATMGVPELVDLLSGFGGEDELCNLSENLGIPCVDCGDGSGDSCISIAAKGIEASKIDVELIEITEPLTHEDCEPAD